MQIVMNAAQEWVDRTGVTVQVSISDHKCGEDLLQASWGCISLRIADIKLFTPPAVGLTSEEPNPTQKIGFSSNVYIASSVTDLTAFYKDVRHELGHALGLYHEAGTVMDPWIHNAPARITCADVGQYNAVRHRVVQPCDVAINSPYEQPAVDSPPPNY